MKITFNFNPEFRAFTLEPEDDLEFAIIAEMASQSAKGQSITLTKISHPDNDLLRAFKIEMKVNGHNSKTTRQEAPLTSSE